MITYKDIIKLSFPIMVGSAVQNLITLTDAIFLGRVGKVEFAAIGLTSIFYLMIITIGFNFTKSGQIMIARRMGEGDLPAVGRITQSMFAFAMFICTGLFFFTKFGSPVLFKYFVQDPLIYDACITYLDARAPGMFFSYMGMCAIALYSGVARPRVIIYNAILLGVANGVLNYMMIFGHWGCPAMGMAGAAWASTISEVLAGVMFAIYVLLDKPARAYRLFARPIVTENDPLDATLPPIQKPAPWVDFEIIKAQITLSLPMIAQSVVGVGSWLAFFFMIEKNMGTDSLAISNLIRTVYMLYMIPCWGFSSGINTIVSNAIGKGRSDLVMLSIHRAAILCFITTMLCCLVLIFIPEQVLLIGTNDMQLINDSLRLLWILVGILGFFCVAGVYFNGLVGTGATSQAMFIQFACVIFYVSYMFTSIYVFKSTLETAWTGELIYWGITLLVSWLFLRAGWWRTVKV